MLIYLSMLETQQEKSKFEQIYHTYKNLMLHTADRILGDSRDTEDVVHQAFLKIIDNLEKIEEVKCHKTRFFIVTIVERTVIDLYRQRKRRTAIPMDEDYINVPATSQIEAVPGYTDLERAMAALPARYRQVILLRFDSGLSYEEIARLLSTNPAKIVQLQIRGLAEDGTRVTAFTRTDAGFEETEGILLDSSRRTGFNVVGITGMYALVDSENLAGIANDPKTYLADTSAYSEQTQTQMTASVQESDSLNTAHSAFPHSLTWSLEDAGLLG